MKKAFIILLLSLTSIAFAKDNKKQEKSKMIKQIQANEKAMKDRAPNEKKAQNLFYKAYQIENRNTPKDRLEAKKIYKKIRNKLKKLK